VGPKISARLIIASGPLRQMVLRQSHRPALSFAPCCWCIVAVGRPHHGAATFHGGCSLLLSASMLGKSRAPRDAAHWLGIRPCKSTAAPRPATSLLFADSRSPLIESPRRSGATMSVSSPAFGSMPTGSLSRRKKRKRRAGRRSKCRSLEKALRRPSTIPSLAGNATASALCTARTNPLVESRQWHRQLVSRRHSAGADPLAARSRSPRRTQPQASWLPISRPSVDILACFVIAGLSKSPSRKPALIS